MGAADATAEEVQDATPVDEPPRLPQRTPPRVTGRQKAAVLLISLGPEKAAEIFKHLREDEIESLSLDMAKQGQIRPDVTAYVFEELAAVVQAYDSLATGGVEYARDVLERSLGSERAAEIIGRLSTVIEMRPFEFLRRTPPDHIVTFLRAEAPQTIALVVANLHTTLAAQVLSCLPEEQQAEIAMRIARMGETPPDVVREIEAVIRRKLENVVQQEYSAAGGVKSLAEILNYTDRPTERNVLDTLSERDSELGEEVRRLLFVFEDIAKLDDRSIQLVLREAEQKDLALALRGVDELVKERILANMSERGAQMLREEMDYQQPQKKRVVEEAQGRIVAIVRRLEDAGTLVIGRGGSDLVI
jgi:flagellar motor switch protein FliG